MPDNGSANSVERPRDLTPSSPAPSSQSTTSHLDQSSPVPDPEFDGTQSPLAGGEGVGGATGGKMPDRGRPPGMGRRRSQSNSSRRPPGRQPLHPSPSAHVYPHSTPSGPPENVHATPALGGFHGNPAGLYQPPAPNFDHRNSYVGPYTMSTQPPMNMGHTQTTFSYGHGFGHPAMRSPSESGLISPNIHSGYQPMLQSHAPVYPYQPHSSEGAHLSHPSAFSASNPSTIYYQATPSPPLLAPQSPLSSQPSGSQQMPAHTPPFGPPSSGFHSLPFSSSPQYGYAPQSFTPSPPMYQPQYPPSFQPHFAPQPKQEGPGTWWYLPHTSGMSGSQYDLSQPSYQGQGHFPVNYPHMARQDVEGYPQGATGTSTPGPSTVYPQSPPSRLSEHMPPLPEPPPPASPIVPPPAAAGVLPSRTEKAVTRRPYHPNPPPNKSDWVMWVGNVPSDTTREELWSFFIQPLSAASPKPHLSDVIQIESPTVDCGVLSIFLISRSNCAFVNFETEARLLSAITRFHGQQLRPNDARCPRLVCRARRNDDDLKTGVGAQRGTGMHTRWVKESKGKQREGSPVSQPPSSPHQGSVTPSSASDRLAANLSSISVSSDDEAARSRQKTHQSSSSGSYASTNSSILAKHFPKRYFILKSLTQSDLDLSVRKDLWATQKHNEGVLDQAYRTAKEVYLIFGVNKSGGFFGYARMAGPVLKGEHKISWAARTDSSSSSRSSQSPTTKRGSIQRAVIPEEPDDPLQSPSQSANTMFFPSEHKFVEESPAQISSLEASSSKAHSPQPSGAPDRTMHSAPAALGLQYQKLSVTESGIRNNTDRAQGAVHSRPPPQTQNPSAEFKLDPTAPMRAMRHHTPAGSSESAPALVPVKEEEPETQSYTREDRGDGWGESFKVEWLCTKPLSFQKTRHLRNAWNHDREIKVSRDGTELEPSVGQRLLDEWDRLAESSHEPAASFKVAAAGTPSRRGGTRSSATSPSEIPPP